MAEDSDTARRLRPKERRIYTDEDVDEDELIEGRRKFCVVEKTLTNQYNAHLVKEVCGDDLTLAYFQENGFTVPLLIKEKSGLNMRVPSESFTIADVKQCVGSRRQLDVMDVNTQKGLEMSMKDWVRYYENTEQRERLLNVISLEFSHTKLENYIEQPQVVRQLDWVENAWPRFLKDSQTECTNIIEKMKYPKVQKYCLMSVRGCYTDFHIDMGGTSVWYHLIHGSKTFWLIPPTERNIELYENWVLSGKQGDIFFGDKVDKCQRIELVVGNTFFIPTGWIHAVYTSEDSLVFGGNFLHSFNIPMQLRISEVEDKTKVPQKFRYPFFQELHWYLVDQYVNCLTGRSYRVKSDEELAEDADDRLKMGIGSNGVGTGSGGGGGNTTTGETTDDYTALRSTEDEDGDSPCRSPLGELHSKSPHYSPHAGSASPRPSMALVSGHQRRSHEDNNIAADRSPKVSSNESPVPIGRIGGSNYGTNYNMGNKDNQINYLGGRSPRRPDSASEISMKRRVEQDIKTYFHQSELIRPVSVKLENCMLTADNKGKTYLDNTGLGGGGGGILGSGSFSSMGSSSGSAFTSTVQSVPPMHRGPWTHLTQWELKGLRILLQWLENLPPNKRMLPKDLQDCDALLRDAKRVLSDHAADDPKAACSGDMILKWPPRKGKKVRHLSYTPRGPKTNKAKKEKEKAAKAKEKAERELKEREKEEEREREREREQREREKDTAAIRRRRVRCKVCEACTRGDCRECHFCFDMKKYGGAGKMKQSCKNRQCMMPVLPTSAVCSVCGKDDRLKVEGLPEPVTTLMECGICWDIAHPACMGVESDLPSECPAVLNEDLPNSWECPKCVGDRKHGHLKGKSLKSKNRPGRVESSGSEASRTEPEDNGSPLHDPSRYGQDTSKRKKHGYDENSPHGTPHHRRRPREHDADSPLAKKRSKGVEEGRGGRAGRTPHKGRATARGRERSRKSGGRVGYQSDSSEFSELEDEYDMATDTSSKDGSPSRIRDRGHSPTMDYDTSSIDGASVSSRKRKDLMMCKPIAAAPVKQTKIALQRYVVRPAPLPNPSKFVKTETGANHALDQEIWMLVFQYLSPQDLCACLRVCRTWNRWCIDRRLWSFINLSRRKILRDVLVGTVRRQPTQLDISWTNINRKQLEWLVSRLPQLKHLSLAGNSWAAVCALCSSSCPLLHSLDLKWVSGIRDACMKDLICPPTDHRPGVDDSLSRLHRLTKLELAGSDVTDATLQLMTQYMPRLEKLDLSYCTKITIDGLKYLAAESSPTCNLLTSLDLTGCNLLTDECFSVLRNLKNVRFISLEACPDVSVSACHNFALRTVPQLNLVVKYEKYIEVDQ